MTEPLKCPLCDAEMPHTPLAAEQNSRDNKTHIYICKECPGILIEWWDQTDTNAFVEFFKNPKDSIRKSNLLYLADYLKVTPQEVETIGTYFKKDIDELFQMSEEGDLVSFASYDEFFTWMHDGMSKEELIQLLANDDNAVNPDQVINTESGRTIFMYE